MSTYIVEYVAPRVVAAGIAVRAAALGHTTGVRPAAGDQTRVRVEFDAPDEAEARQVALTIKGDTPTVPCLRQGHRRFGRVRRVA